MDRTWESTLEGLPCGNALQCSCCPIFTTCCRELLVFAALFFPLCIHAHCNRAHLICYWALRYIPLQCFLVLFVVVISMPCLSGAAASALRELGKAFLFAISVLLMCFFCPAHVFPCSEVVLPEETSGWFHRCSIVAFALFIALQHLPTDAVILFPAVPICPLFLRFT